MITGEHEALSRAVGQLLVGGFPGFEIHEEFAALVREGRAGGVVLFERNIESLEQAANLVTRLTQLTHTPRLWVAIDQEGGRVQRLRAPFPELPPMRALGETKKKTFAQRAGHLLGQSLSMFGIDQDYAPVLDVDSNPDNPLIGDRSFSRDPSVVARLGAAFIDGLQSTRVAACGKHFPGHGDTSEDSHHQLPSLPHDRARLDEIELVPFRAAVRTDVASIMTAHVMFPALDADHPATLSEQVIKTLLRDELGFDGVIITDDLEMKAIADHYSIEEAAVRAIRAGCDQLLICHQPSLVERAHRAIMDAVQKGTLARSQVLEAADRVRRMRAGFTPIAPRPAPEEVVAFLPKEEHESFLRALVAKSPDEVAEAGGPTGESERIVEFEFEGDPDLELELDR
jgi:beta-N-acetylhexosaminidase